MLPFETKYVGYTIGLFVFTLNSIHAMKNLIRIPVSINPIVQVSCVEISHTARFFYQMDTEFYSRVTVSDAARNEGKDVANIITKKIGVVFLIVVSSHISGSLTLNNLKYQKHKSKWSYQIPVQDLIEASDGAFTKLSDKMPIYKVQELAMKVLERRYEFKVDSILQKLRLKQIEFYAADKKLWIDIVGSITDNLIKIRSKRLNLTPCYLAELVNKTEMEMKAFTLNEVDMFLYNITSLMNKLSAYRSATVSSLYEKFNVTEAQLVSMSNINRSVISTMGLKNFIEVLTTTILKKLQLSIAEISSAYQKPETGIVIPCQQDLDYFLITTVRKAFESEARDMSMTTKTLASLINIYHKNVKTLSVGNMLQLVSTVIKPLKDDKTMIENFTLSTLKKVHGLKKLNTNKRNAIALIKIFTSFTKHQLKLLYGWTTHDHHFAKLFSVDDLARVCSFDVYKHSLLSLTKINMGKKYRHFKCKSFAALRSIWGQTSLRDLKERFNLLKDVPLTKPIATTVSFLTNSTTTISCRVLSNTPMIRWLLTKVTLNNISALTNYSTEYLKELSFQRMMVFIHELQIAGSFETIIKSVSFIHCAIEAICS